MSQAARRALDAPRGDLALLSSALIATVIEHSRTHPRRRMLLPFHKTADDGLHRMLNAVQPDSYVRPHRHADPPKAEAWIMLRGAAAFFTFEDDGRVRACARLAAGSDVFGVDLVAGVYHTVLALEPDTVFYEAKTGPYAPHNDKAFAPFAPEEDTPSAAEYLAWLRAEFERLCPER
jgi:cupin fold WbuC family metalloprotein